MKKVKLLINEDYIVIELKNNDISSLWLNNIRQQNDMSIRSVSDPHYIDPVNNQDYTSGVWNKIKENINTIETEFNIKWPEEVPDVFNFDQQIMNRYHRYFAQSTMFYNRWQIDHDYRFDEIPVEKQKRFSDLLEEINFSIHELESYTITPRIQKYKNKIKKLYIDFSPTNWINLPHNTVHSADKEYNVCIAMEVHGKNYLQAFIDDDVPFHPDVHGQRGMFGRIDIYTDDTVFDILESEEFKNWLGTESIKDYSLVQLGKVIESSQPLSKLYDVLASGVAMEIIEL